jgi:1-deoxy-D-xylulose-5-phosphate synthase
MGKLLDNINTPQDLHLLSVEELGRLAVEIRAFITHSVSQTGGHLSSNLGVVELTLAMHYVFDFSEDKLLWDVGHQCYAHKILTGRKDEFDGLRQQGGISGFPNPNESEYDQFSVGHAGTSIATALGMALGSQQNNTNEKVVAMVGDASIVNGLSFEALNNLGLVKRQMLIVLNDNSMAIDATPGSVAKFLSKVRLSHTYDDMKKTANHLLDHLPLIGKKMEEGIRNFKKTLRMAVSPNRLFESLNIPYFGPIDGHDIGSLIEIFRTISELDRPVILHAYTRKGKGFRPADDNPSKFHSTGPFQIDAAHEDKPKSGVTFTSAFADALVAEAANDDKMVAITAAMADGTGLAKFRKEYPERFYDVGIAESVAVDVAAGLAKQGLKPVVCIYSTFLQRAYDQIFQEVSMQNLPVVFCIDRAGVVGDDGPTHHGMMDVGFMRMMPNMEVIAPACNAEITGALRYALGVGKPVAIRYPKGYVPDSGLDDSSCKEAFESGKSVTLRNGTSDIVIAACGSVVVEAVKAAEMLSGDGVDVTVINARFAWPVDGMFVTLLEQGKTLITVEDHCLAGGFGSAVLEMAAGKMSDAGGEGFGKISGRVITLGRGNEFVPVAKRNVQLSMMNISADGIVGVVKRAIG